MKYGVDAIKSFNTRSVTVEICEGTKKTKTDDGSEKIVDNVIASIELSRLPVDELLSYMSLFEGFDPKNPSTLYNKKKLDRIFEYIIISLVSSNEGITKEEAREFVATYFTQLLPPFIEVNGEGASVSGVPDDIRKNLNIT